MYKNQAFITCCYLASQGDVEHFAWVANKLVGLVYSETNTLLTSDGSNYPVDEIPSCSLFHLLAICIFWLPKSLPAKQHKFVESLVRSVAEYHRNHDEHPSADTSLEVSQFEVEEVLTDLGIELPGLSKLIDVSPDSVSKRAQILYAKIRQDSAKFGWSGALAATLELISDKNTDTSTTADDILFQFAKARIMVVDEMISDLDGSELVLDTIARDSKQAQGWKTGFLHPLSNLRLVVSSLPHLIEWERSGHINCVSMILRPVTDSNAALLIAGSLIPYLTYNNAWDIFSVWLIEFCNESLAHNMDITVLERNYVKLTAILSQSLLMDEISRHQGVSNIVICTITAQIYMCPVVSLNVFVAMKQSLSFLKSLVKATGTPVSHQLGDAQLEKLATTKDIREVIDLLSIEPTSSSIESVEKLVESAQRLYSSELSVIDILKLSESTQETQVKEFTKFLNNETKSLSSSNPKQWVSVLNSVYWIYNNTGYFNKIDRLELDKTVLVKILDMRCLSVTEKFFEFSRLQASDYDVIFSEYCWNFFNKATNLDITIGWLRTCLECLKLWDDIYTRLGIRERSTSSLKITNLIDSFHTLMQYRIYFQTGVPLTPKYINELHDTEKIVSKILELNPKAYLEFDNLKPLFIKLEVGFGKQPDSDAVNLKLQIMCLEYSLGSSDFEFASQSALKLLDKPAVLDQIQDNWLVFYQVCKYISMIEDSESEEIEMLETQLEVCSKLLMCVPIEFYNLVLSQWTLLESSLSSKVAATVSAQNQVAKKPKLNDTSLQSRLQRSLNSAALEVLNGDSNGNGLISWAFGA